MLFCALSLLLACTNPATRNNITGESMKQQDQGDAKTYVYECRDGYGFVASCKNNRAMAIWEDAKLRGVDFRAIGNEPGWNLEIIKSEKIVFVGDYGQERYEFITTEPSIDRQARTTVYDVQNDKHELSVIILGRRCNDTMSGEAFETTVSVILDGKKYRGCGKALH